MNSSKRIREQLGLTQNQMAHYLQINRSLLTLSETGKRDLPLHALIKLSEMELFLANKDKNKTKALPHKAAQLEKAAAIVAQHQKEMEYQQLLLQKKLEKLQTKCK